MKRDDVVSKIENLPISDAVAGHARRLIYGLPEWCPMPSLVRHYDVVEGVRFVWKIPMDERGIVEAVTVTVTEKRTGAVWRTRADSHWQNGKVDDKKLHELLRQLTGMVALTGGG